MGKSCIDGYLTEKCRTCPFWADGSIPDKGIGCTVTSPLKDAPFFGKICDYFKDSENVVTD